MGFADAAKPESCKAFSQCFRLSNTLEWRALRRFDQLVNAPERLFILSLSVVFPGINGEGYVPHRWPFHFPLFRSTPAPVSARRAAVKLIAPDGRRWLGNLEGEPFPSNCCNGPATSLGHRARRGAKGSMEPAFHPSRNIVHPISFASMWFLHRERMKACFPRLVVEDLLQLLTSETEITYCGNYSRCGSTLCGGLRLEGRR